MNLFKVELAIITFLSTSFGSVLSVVNYCLKSCGWVGSIILIWASGKTGCVLQSGVALLFRIFVVTRKPIFDGLDPLFATFLLHIKVKQNFTMGEPQLANFGINFASTRNQQGSSFMLTRHLCKWNHFSQWSKNTKVWTERWRSKIHSAFERGAHSDIKTQNIFSICRGKILTIFKENLGRVTPCPSTWHKYQNVIEKFWKVNPFYGTLNKRMISVL